MNNILIVGLDNRSCDFIRFLRSKISQGKINGYDLDFDLFKNAIDQNLIDNREFDSIERIIINSDIIVLNLPISRYDTVFLKISSFVPEGCVITNFNTAKECIYKNNRPNLNWRKSNFIQSNCLFEMRNIENTINKKVLINADITSRLGMIKKLASFWNMFDFDTENINVIDNDHIMSNVLHVPFVLSLILFAVFRDLTEKSGIENESLLTSVDVVNDYLFEDIFCNIKNVSKDLKHFVSLMSGLKFDNDGFKVIFQKALKARDKKRKIFKIHSLQRSEKELREMTLVQAVNFLIETLFVEEFVNLKNIFCLNFDVVNFNLISGQEFVCARTINDRQKEFLVIWKAFIKRVKEFVKLLKGKDLNAKKIKSFLLSDVESN